MYVYLFFLLLTLFREVRSQHVQKRFCTANMLADAELAHSFSM